MPKLFTMGTDQKQNMYSGKVFNQAYYGLFGMAVPKRTISN